jgi:hypothetical protein
MAANGEKIPITSFAEIAGVWEVYELYSQKMWTKDKTRRVFKIHPDGKVLCSFCINGKWQKPDVLPAKLDDKGCGINMVGNAWWPVELEQREEGLTLLMSEFYYKNTIFRLKKIK